MANISYSTDQIWRSLQSDFILTSESIKLHKSLSTNYSIKELIVRRLTTDSVENLFSQKRSHGQSHPNSVNCKYAISFCKRINISESSNYSQDVITFFLSLNNLKKP